MHILEIPITPVFINGNLNSLLAYPGSTIVRIELFFICCQMQDSKKAHGLVPASWIDD